MKFTTLPPFVKSSFLAASLGTGMLACPVANAKTAAKATAVEISVAPGDTLAPPEEGKNLTMTFRPGDWAILKDKKAFVDFHDRAYEAMAELTGNRPPMPIRGHHELTAWGTASASGVRVDWPHMPGVMADFNKNLVSFGLIHEMGHIFDYPFYQRWYVTHNIAVETFANFKLAFAVERLLTDETPYRIDFRRDGAKKGAEFVDGFYLPYGEEYLKSDTPWEKISVDSLHAFHHQLVRKYGWDFYKKMFRVFIQLEATKDGKVPSKADDPLRLQVLCAVLNRLSGDELMPFFQKWRVPVTAEDLARVTETYKLDQLCEKVEEDFRQGVVKGEIHLDPLSLHIQPMKASNGKTGFTISNVFGDWKDVGIRCSIDGSDPVAGGGKPYEGKPIAAPAGTTVKAALYVKGKEGAQLTATLVIPDNL